MSKLPSTAYSTSNVQADLLNPSALLCKTNPTTARDRSTLSSEANDYCLHRNKFSPYSGHTNCSDCGAIILKNDTVLRDQQVHKEIDMPQMEIYLKMLNDEPFQTYVVFSEETFKNRKCAKDIIDWLFQLGDQFKQRNLTVHIAIVYFERAMQLKFHVNISESELRTMALTCMIIASKYDELDDNIPFVRDIIRKVGSPIGSYSDVMQWQHKLLHAFDFDLMVLTPLNFIDCLTAQGVVFESDQVIQTSYAQTRKNKSLFKESLDLRQSSQVTIHSDKLLSSVRKYAEFFADLACHSYEIRKYPISKIAIACIIASRKKNNIDPLWNPNLHQITTYTWNTIQPVFQELYSFFESCFEQTAKSSVPNSSQASPVTRAATTRPTTVSSNKQSVLTAGISNLKKAQIKSNKSKKNVENTLKKVIVGALGRSNKENIQNSFMTGEHRDKMNSSMLQPLFQTSSRQTLHPHQSQVSDEYQALKPNIYTTETQKPHKTKPKNQRESLPCSSEYYNQFKSSSQSVSPLKDLANYMSGPSQNTKKVPYSLVLKNTRSKDKKAMHQTSLLNSQSAVSLLNATKFAKIVLQKEEHKQGRRQSMKPLSSTKSNPPIILSNTRDIPHTNRPVSSKLAQFHQNKDALVLKKICSNKEMIAFMKQNFLQDTATNKSRSQDNLNKHVSLKRKHIGLGGGGAGGIKVKGDTVQLHLIGSLTNRNASREHLNMSSMVGGVSEYSDPAPKKYLAFNSKRLTKKIAQSTLSKCASQISNSILATLKPSSTKSTSRTRIDGDRRTTLNQRTKHSLGGGMARHASYLHIVDEEMSARTKVRRK